MYKVRLENFNIDTIMDSGQCFRINKIKNNEYTLILLDKFLHIRVLDDDYSIYEFSCSEKEFKNFFMKYFDLNTDYSFLNKFSNSNDKFLKNCINYTKGIKILNQDKFETLIEFIISQRKSIPAIKTSIERLCKLCGRKIENKYGIFYTFPKPIDIMKCKKSYLENIGIGYRLPYIMDATEKVLNGEINLEKISNLDNEELKNKLMEIKGVGEKVASCVMLFAYHRLDVCPKDVWINRVLDKYYKNGIPKKYNRYIGIIQQCWFNYAKDFKI